MARHILQLDIVDVSADGVFVINDISVYTAALGIECPELQILPPGASVPSVINGFSTGFHLVLNACTIGMIAAPGCNNSCPILPDGIWHIRYSVAPNDRVYVEYDYLRTTVAMSTLIGLYCSVGMKPCLPDQETIYDVQQLDLIRDYIIAAKGLVEQEHKTEDGINLFRYALSLISKFSSCRRGCRI